MTDELHGTQGSPRPRRPNPDPSGVREARQDLRRVAQTVGWGDGAIDKALIAAYYSLLVASRMFRPRQALGAGIHPEFWLGDLSVRTPIGRFPCRARTTDFDIVSPNYEAPLVNALETRLRSSRSEPTVFVDVGVHIGKCSVLAGRLLRNRGRVLSIEADSENFRCLERNPALNGLRGVRARNVGCWSEDGVQVLYRRRGNLGGHSFVEVGGSPGTPVRVRTLDGVLRDEGLSDVDVIKLDVERAEAQVLRGAHTALRSNPRITIFLEGVGDPRVSESLQFLRDAGFHVRHIGGLTYSAERRGA